MSALKEIRSDVSRLGRGHHAQTDGQKRVGIIQQKQNRKSVFGHAVECYDCWEMKPTSYPCFWVVTRVFFGGGLVCIVPDS